MRDGCWAVGDGAGQGRGNADKLWKSLKMEENGLGVKKAWKRGNRLSRGRSEVGRRDVVPRWMLDVTRRYGAEDRQLPNEG